MVRMGRGVGGDGGGGGDGRGWEQAEAAVGGEATQVNAAVNGVRVPLGDNPGKARWERTTLGGAMVLS